MRSSKPFVLFSALALQLGCGGLVVGSGRAAEDARTVPSFTRLSVQDAVHATVTVGPSLSLRLRGDDNVLPLVLTEVRGDTLFVHLPPLTVVQSSAELRLELTVPALAGVEASGASSATITGLATPTFQATASGASRVRASGAATALTLSASGSSRLELDELLAQDAELDASGACDASLRVSAALRGRASGATRVHLHGSTSAGGLELSGGSSVDFAP